MGSPYWKNILSRSQKRPEAEGQGTFLRPRQNIFPVRADLNSKQDACPGVHSACREENRP